MQRYLIMCRSLTYAQRANSALERAGITASISRDPQGLTGNGCGYCIRVAERHFQSALNVLNRANAAYGKLYRAEPDGRYVEVAR